MYSTSVAIVSEVEKTIATLVYYTCSIKLTPVSQIPGQTAGAYEPQATPTPAQCTQAPLMYVTYAHAPNHSVPVSYIPGK